MAAYAADRVRLDTDFTDYYDICFAGRHSLSTHTFVRRSDGGPDKQTQFNWLRRLGWRTPHVGRVADLRDHCGPDHGIVVYTDERAHRGEGKLFLRAADAWKQYPEHFGAVYVGYYGAGFPDAHSTRYLFIGARCWVLDYAGHDPHGGVVWMSNRAPEVTIKLLGEVHTPLASSWGLAPEMWDYPLYAVDTATDSMGRAHAVDLNVAPQVRGTGIERSLEARTCAELIARAVVHGYDAAPRAKNLVDRLVTQVGGPLRAHMALLDEEEEDEEWG